MNLIRTFWADEAGFIISAELVLVATIVVIGLVVGLSELAHSLVTELNDVGTAISCLNQSYAFSGFRSNKGGDCGAFSAGSAFADTVDECDREVSLVCQRPSGEASFR